MMMTNITTNCDRESRAGQAAVETAIWLVAFSLIVVAIIELGGVLLVGNDQLEHARRDAGLAALSQSSGTREYGNATVIATAARPHAEGVQHPLPADPWNYPLRTLPQAAHRMAPWQAGTPDAIELRSGSAAKRMDVTFSTLGVPLFPNGIHLSEHVYLPPTVIP